MSLLFLVLFSVVGVRASGTESHEIIKMFIHPEWVLSMGLSDNDNQITGSFKLELQWNNSHTALEDPRDIIVIDNFADGKREYLGKLLMGDKIFTAMTFVGGFKQMLTESCYPFDQQTIKWKINILHPGEHVFEYSMFCPERALKGGLALAKPAEGSPPHEDVDICYQPSTVGSSVGFKWEELECEKLSSNSIECSMVGYRVSEPKLMTYFLPAILFSFLSFGSFALPSTAQMPRVAVSMIALLSIMNLKGSLATKLPSLDVHSWLEDVILVGIGFMFLNVLGHAAVFLKSFDHYTPLVNMFNGLLMPSLYAVVTSTRLMMKDCQSIHGTAVILSAVSAVLLVLFLLAFGWSAFKLRGALTAKVSPGGSSDDATATAVAVESNKDR